MGVRVKPIKEKFDVCIDIEDSENGKRYYIYKEVNGMKLWVTKYKKARQMARGKGLCNELRKCNKDSKSNFRGRNKIKIVSKAIDRNVECTIFGFVYDTRKIKKEWLR